MNPTLFESLTAIIGDPEKAVSSDRNSPHRPGSAAIHLRATTVKAINLQPALLESAHP
jgi:hypothetical protein